MEIETLRNLVKWAEAVSSTTMLLHQERELLKAVFAAINEYSIKTVNGTVNKEFNRTNRSQKRVITNGGIQKVQIMLPYYGKPRYKLLSEMKKTFEQIATNWS